MEHFLEMGGYARFVWPAFALGLAVFAWNVIAARRLLAEARERAQRQVSAGRVP
jgi:heme exporter protein CcmD